MDYSIRHIWIIYFLMLAVIYSLAASLYFYREREQTNRVLQHVIINSVQDKKNFENELKQQLEKKKHNLKQQKVSAEIECLAKNIYFEARGENLQGKKAVAFVTMNRVNHKQYPNSVCNVVYQKYKNVCQFSWVCELKHKIKNHKEYTKAKKIAYNVFHRLTDDNTNGALYFHNRYMLSSWSYEKQYITRIGNHVFYK